MTVVDEVQVAGRMKQGELLARIAESLTGGDVDGAERLAEGLDDPPVTTIRFPLAGPEDATVAATAPRPPSLNPRQKLRIYLRDGFIDRYSPERWKLVHPGALRVISLRLPRQVPTDFGPHNIPAKCATNAPIWFDVWPAVDHFVPRASAGTNEPGNLVCVSWWRNDSKGRVSFTATGWELQPPGELAAWDGLTAWFHDQVQRDPSLRDDPMVRNWHMPDVRASD